MFFVLSLSQVLLVVVALLFWATDAATTVAELEGEEDGSVFTFGDVMIFAMCFPNVLGLYFLMPNVRKAYDSYMSRIKSGEIARTK